MTVAERDRLGAGSVDANRARTSSIARMLRPDSVAVIGASREPGRVGHSIVRNLSNQGYWGRIYGVNRGGGIGPGNVTYYRSIAELPETPDLAIVCLPADLVVGAVEECGELGVGGALIIAADMGEKGGDGVARAAGLVRATERYGIRIIGPNTNGLIVRNGSLGALWATYGDDVAPAGSTATSMNIGFVGQGGGLNNYLGRASLARIGVAAGYIIDTGNELDVDAADCLSFLGTQPAIDTVGLVVESAKRGRKLCASVASLSDCGIRTSVLRLGRTAAGVGAAALHTGALASGNAAFWDELRAVGAFVTGDERDFVASLSAVSEGRQMRSSPPSVGILTWSGGFGVHVTDLLDERRVPLARFADPPTDIEASALLTARPSNPLDLGGRNAAGSGLDPEERLKHAVGYVLRQPEVDVCVLFEGTIPLRAEIFARHLPILANAIKTHEKPIYMCCQHSLEAGLELRELGVTPFLFPSDLAARLAAFAPTEAPMLAQIGGSESLPKPAASAQRTVRLGTDAMAILEPAGMNWPRSEVIEGPPYDATQASSAIGLPLVLKLVDPALVHKSEQGAVQSVHSATQAQDVATRLGALKDELGLRDAVIVAEQHVSGFEVAVGAYVDAELGPTVMVGRGGVGIEVDQDVAFALAPVNATRVRTMLRGLHCWPLLSGIRAPVAYDVDALVGLVVRLSTFIAVNQHRYVGVDINPVMVLSAGRGVLAVDAVVQEAFP